MSRRRIARATGVLLLAATVLLAAVVYWLFYDNRLPSSGQFVIDLDRLRAVASQAAGPTRIEVEEVSHTFVPKIGVVAGTSWRRFDMVRASYRLVYPDRSVVIDTGWPFWAAKQSGAATYDFGAWRRIQQELPTAAVIVVTHEHADHIGGVMGSPALSAILQHARLTPEQVENSIRTDPFRWPAAALRGYQPLRYRDLYVVAPGVVLIRAPGHTPGSQMIYVRREDGREFIFMGDVASAADNVRLERIRPRYTTTYHHADPDDRRAVMLQTVALHDLQARHPEILLVPGHDAVAIRELERQHLLVRGFRLK